MTTGLLDQRSMGFETETRPILSQAELAATHGLDFEAWREELANSDVDTANQSVAQVIDVLGENTKPNRKLPASRLLVGVAASTAALGMLSVGETKTAYADDYYSEGCTQTSPNFDHVTRVFDPVLQLYVNVYWCRVGDTTPPPTTPAPPSNNPPPSGGGNGSPPKATNPPKNGPTYEVVDADDDYFTITVGSDGSSVPNEGYGISEINDNSTGLGQPGMDQLAQDFADRGIDITGLTPEQQAFVRNTGYTVNPADWATTLKFGGVDLYATAPTTSVVETAAPPADTDPTAETAAVVSTESDGTPNSAPVQTDQASTSNSSGNQTSSTEIAAVVGGNTTSPTGTIGSNATESEDTLWEKILVRGGEGAGGLAALWLLILAARRKRHGHEVGKKGTDKPRNRRHPGTAGPAAAPSGGN